VAATALEAAEAHHTALPGEDVAGQIVADLATQLLVLDDRIKRLDKQIREAFRTHPQAGTIESLPGMGPVLGAEFIVAAGDIASFADAGNLASAAGLVPVPRDSGRRTGNLHRPKRYSRRLRRVFSPQT
jgi:transposase